MKAVEMNVIFDRCIANYHLTDNVDVAEKNPHPKGSLEYTLYHKAWIDTVQWHLEDIIRDPAIDPDTALSIKRRIDRSNQERTDEVERIDDYYFALFEQMKPQEGARLNTESPAWAIDRLCILALKIYHMRIEAEREDLYPELKSKNQLKLETLKIQRSDLSLAIDQLLDDLASGRRIMKVYRQMKMYNDPELNPILYARKAP
jgi:hypothetical protein